MKGRWGWVDVDVGSSEKISLQDLYPHWPARKRDCDQRRWGYRVNKTDHRKIIAAGPTAGRGTGLRFEDDGVAPMTSAHIRIKPEEIIAAGPIPPLAGEET
jgi:hypothetical protein